MRGFGVLGFSGLRFWVEGFGLQGFGGHFGFQEGSSRPLPGFEYKETFRLPLKVK